MTTLQVINKIADSPEVTNVVVCDQDDKNPMDAIAYLCYWFPNKTDWHINTSLEGHNTMLLY